LESFTFRRREKKEGRDDWVKLKKVKSVLAGRRKRKKQDPGVEIKKKKRIAHFRA